MLATDLGIGIGVAIVVAIRNYDRPGNFGIKARSRSIPMSPPMPIPVSSISGNQRRERA